MVSYKLKSALKQYIANLDLCYVLNNEMIARNAKIIFYLMQQIHKNLNNKKELALIKRCIKDMTELYVIKNDHLSFNNDIKSIEINKKQLGANYAYAVFSNNNDSKYMLMGFTTEKILNKDLLYKNIIDLQNNFFNPLKNVTKISLSFLKDYFLFLKKNSFHNSLENIEIFLENYIRKAIQKFYAHLFLNANKLNILH